MKKLAIASALALASLNAQAALITFTSLSAEWFDPDAVTDIDFADPGLGVGASSPDVAKVRWGGNETTGSGYDFAPADTSSLTDLGADEVFVLGEFTHFNRPIDAGNAIDGISLRVRADLTFNGTAFNNNVFTFRFTHLETPNNADPCAVLPGTGALESPGGGTVNDNDCADLVTVASLGDNTVVGTGFSLNVQGFEALVGDFFEPTTSFLSGENATNGARLVASFVQTDVPAPAPAALFGLGLLALGVARRRSAT
jgi:hypothetical protein